MHSISDDLSKPCYVQAPRFTARSKYFIRVPTTINTLKAVREMITRHAAAQANTNRMAIAPRFYPQIQKWRQI